MSVRVYGNNVYSYLSGNINNSVTTIPVLDSTAYAAALSGSANGYIALAIDDRTNFEIVHCTAASSNNLTVTRAQQGTSASSFTTGTVVECRPTASSFFTPSADLVEARTLGSATANVDFTGLAGSYLLVIERLDISAATADLRMRFGYGGTPTYDTGSNYSTCVNRISSVANTVTINNATGQTSFKINGNETLFTGNPANGRLEITDTTSTNYNSFKGSLSYVYTSPSTNIARAESTGAWIDATNAVTAIRIFASTGNIASGTKFYLYKRPAE